MYEEEQRARDEQHELANKAERRANDLQLEIEELRANLEQVGSVGVCILQFITCMQGEQNSSVKQCWELRKKLHACS